VLLATTSNDGVLCLCTIKSVAVITEHEEQWQDARWKKKSKLEFPLGEDSSCTLTHKPCAQGTWDKAEREGRQIYIFLF
jgi:hypothetical protein